MQRFSGLVKVFHDIYCCVIDLGLVLESFKGSSFLLNCAFRLYSCQFAWIGSQVLPSIQKKPILEELLLYRIGGKPGETQDQTMMIEAASIPVSCSDLDRILALSVSSCPKSIVVQFPKWGFRSWAASKASYTLYYYILCHICFNVTEWAVKII